MAVIYKAPKEEQKAVAENIVRHRRPEGDSPSETGKKKSRRRGVYHDIVREIRGTVGLSVDPKGVEFIDKDRDEDTLVVLRRHLITNVPWAATTLAMFLAILLAGRFNWLALLPSALQAVIVYGWFVVALLVAWAGFLSWYFNVNIISSKRIIDFDFHDLIYREVSDANLDKIEDVTHNMGGLLGIVFNFGDIYIQTAGTKPQIEFIKVPHPAQVASTLRKLREAVEK
jgi:hypothetical protein